MKISPFTDTQSRHHFHHACGLTLIELLTALAIFSILATVGIPQLSYWLARAEADNVSKTLYKHLQTTRDIAVSQREQITLCMLDSSGQCNANAAETLVIFKDKDRNRQYNKGERIIVQTPFKPSGKLRLNAKLGVVRFNDVGNSHTFSSFIYCPKSIEPSHTAYPLLVKKVTIRLTGRIYIDGRVNNAKAAKTLC